MIRLRQRLAAIKAALGLWSRGWRRGEAGAVSPVFVLMLVPLIGGLGMAAEASNWYLTQRALQNAADSAAIAAAANGTTNEGTRCTVAGDFCLEAKAAAANMGFTDGAGNVTVTTHYTTTCPGTVTNCYSVSIKKLLSISLLQVVGFKGDTTAGGAPAQTVTASAIAKPRAAVDLCMMALGTGAKVFKLNGLPKSDLVGCDLWSNGDLACDGQSADAGVPYGGAVGNSSCGATQASNQAKKADPFGSLSANIPANTCTSYPQNTGAASQPLSASTSGPLCGNYHLTGDWNITTPGKVITIYNGSLDLFGHKLSTSGSGSVTLIFSGTVQNGGPVTYNHMPVNTTGSGVIDIAAPTSGTFKGVAIMQDSNLTGNKNNLDMTYTGNNPTLDIQGLIYMPNGNFTIKGAINLHSSGLSCIGIIAQTINVSGTGAIFPGDGVGPTADCTLAGLTLPTVLAGKLALVQ